MKRHTKSILEELSSFSNEKNRDIMIETRGTNIIETTIHLLESIDRYYDQETAADLEKRILGSIKTRDSSKFARGMQKCKKKALTDK